MHMSVDLAVLTGRISKVNIKISSPPPFQPFFVFMLSIRLIPVETITHSVFVKWRKNNVLFFTVQHAAMCVCANILWLSLLS